MFDAGAASTLNNIFAQRWMEATAKQYIVIDAVNAASSSSLIRFLQVSVFSLWHLAGAYKHAHIIVELEPKAWKRAS